MAKKPKTKKPSKPNLFLTIIKLLLVVALGVFGYWYFSIKTPNLPQPSLKVLAAKHGVELGVHASLDRLADKPYTDIVTSQFSFLTIDGEANWNFVHSTPTQYNYTKVDKLMAFAKANNMPVQIHHLIWGEQNFLPNWLKNTNYTSAELLNIMHDYGLSDWWADHTGGGTTYVDDAFIWAHQTDPNAKLILNDFNNETENSISNAEYNYILAAKARGVPIDGIGMQMHINAIDPPSIVAMVKNMQRFGAIGVPTYITEADVNLNSVKGSSTYKTQLEAQIYYDVVRACIESKSCVSFDEFGVSDKESLLKMLFSTNSHSYLFTSRYDPKPSFYAFREAWIQT